MYVSLRHLVAELPVPSKHELVGMAGAVTTIFGMWLHAQIPWHSSDAEELAKDGKLTEEMARQRIRFIVWRAAAITLVGVALFLAAVFGLWE
jgi:hypothetical protein